MGNRCNSYCRSIFVALICAMALASCDVHEFPYQVEPAAPSPPPKPEENVIELKLNLTGMQYLTTLDFSNSVRSRATKDAVHSIRHIVQIYNPDNKSSRVISRDVTDRFDIINDEVSPNVTIPLHDLEPGSYTIASWSEYIPHGISTDFYHDTDNFSNITLRGETPGDSYTHHGSNPYREAWCGNTSITVDTDGTVHDRNSAATNIISIEMQRPMARYHFITTDLEDFIRAESADGFSFPDFNDYRIIVRYAAYMPYIFNIFTDKPVDSLTGVYYEGAINQIDSKTAELAFDYIFTNGKSTSTQVVLELYRKSDGKLISSSDIINIPLIRDKYTLVKGHFLTTSSGGSVGVNPEFNGQYNIEII